MQDRVTAAGKSASPILFFFFFSGAEWRKFLFYEFGKEKTLIGKLCFTGVTEALMRLKPKACLMKGLKTICFDNFSPTGVNYD